MNRPHAPANLPDPTTNMTEGWHCLHIYFQIDQSVLQQIDAASRDQGRAEIIRILDPAAEHAPIRMQVSVVTGHRADLGS